MVTELIHKHFSYLFTELGFKLISEIHFEHFDNWVIVLGSSEFCIRFLQDRGEITLALGPWTSNPSWDANHWYDIRIIIAYTTHDAIQKESKEQDLVDKDQQLARLSELFSTYQNEIINIFKRTEFKKYEKDIDFFSQEWTEQFLKRFFYQDNKIHGSCN